MTRRRDLITTTEHHGEGILEFHVTDPTHAVSARECKLALLLVMSLIVGRMCLGLPLCEVATWKWASGAGILAMVLLRRMGHLQQESLLVVHDLGVQVRRTYYSGKKDFEFVERARIVDVIINEGVRYATVTYYLAIMVKGSSEMLLGFSELVPELPHLLAVYHGLRNVLYGDELPQCHQSGTAPLRDGQLGAGGAKTSILDLSDGGERPGGQRSLYLGSEGDGGGTPGSTGERNADTGGWGSRNESSDSD